MLAKHVTALKWTNDMTIQNILDFFSMVIQTYSIFLIVFYALESYGTCEFCK